MDIKTIAKANGVSERFVYFVVNGERYSDLIFLIEDIAKMTGKRPIDYVRPDRRAIFKKHYPELGRKRAG